MKVYLLPVVVLAALATVPARASAAELPAAPVLTAGLDICPGDEHAASAARAPGPDVTTREAGRLHEYLALHARAVHSNGVASVSPWLDLLAVSNSMTLP